jgi:hypothetical protein
MLSAEGYPTLIPGYDFVPAVYTDAKDRIIERADAKRPLEVRAHRVWFPHLLRAITLLDAETTVDERLSELRGVLNNPKATPYDLWYAHDILGDETEAGLAIVRSGWLPFLRKYVQLDDADPIYLIAKKDDICRGCIFGGHCKYDQDDHEYMTNFIEAASELGRVYGADYLPLFDATGNLAQVNTNKRTVADVAAHRVVSLADSAN